jgi:hypothetical protein
MAGQGQFKRATTTRWTQVDPILAIGEIGIDKTLNIFKIGDGILHWSALPIANLGATGPQGPTGATGTGLSRTLTTTINFGVEDTYVTKDIVDAAILTASVIQVIVLDEDFIVQGVSCGVLSISNGVGYTIWGFAPNGATGICNINILIYQ